MSETQNVHARKLAVMKRCSEIKTDGEMEISNRKIKYVSVQELSNKLRAYCADEGLDIVPSISDGQIVIELVNVDDPADRIVSNWPLVPQDKGWSYSIKYPLMRLFLVGDGDEDEAGGAEQSGKAATEAAQKKNGHKQAEPPADSSAVSLTEMEQLFTLTDGLRDREVVEKLVREFGYAKVFSRAKSEREIADKRVAQQVTAALDVPPAGSDA